MAMTKLFPKSYILPVYGIGMNRNLYGTIEETVLIRIAHKNAAVIAKTISAPLLDPSKLVSSSTGSSAI
jgi:hypothetical protein